MNYEIRKYKKTDFKNVINLDLKQQDRDEIKAVSGSDTIEALTNSLKHSKHTWVGIFNGKIECVFGLGEASSSIGTPWMLSTKEINNHKIVFSKESKRIIKIMLSLYPLLINVVDSRNTDSIKWLTWLGFNIDYNHPYYFSKHKFYKFSMIKDG